LLFLTKVSQSKRRDKDSSFSQCIMPCRRFLTRTCSYRWWTIVEQKSVLIISYNVYTNEWNETYEKCKSEYPLIGDHCQKWFPSLFKPSVWAYIKGHHFFHIVWVLLVLWLSKSEDTSKYVKKHPQSCATKILFS
jgi:hypothetical protein